MHGTSVLDRWNIMCRCDKKIKRKLKEKKQTTTCAVIFTMGLKEAG